MHRPKSKPEATSTTTWIAIGVVLFIVLLAVPRLGMWGLMIFLLVGIPIIKSVVRAVTSAVDDNTRRRANYAQPDARSRAYRAPSAHPLEYEEEKPKRRPEYVVGDDGELVELDEVLEDEKPKHGQSSGGNFYV